MAQPGGAACDSRRASGDQQRLETHMDIDRKDTALVITDPQNDFLSPTE